MSYKSSNILNISPATCVLYASLACKIVVSISANWVFVTLANLMMLWSWSWMLAIVSIPLIIL